MIAPSRGMARPYSAGWKQERGCGKTTSARQPQDHVAGAAERAQALNEARIEPKAIRRRERGSAPHRRSRGTGPDNRQKGPTWHHFFATRSFLFKRRRTPALYHHWTLSSRNLRPADLRPRRRRRSLDWRGWRRSGGRSCRRTGGAAVGGVAGAAIGGKLPDRRRSSSPLGLPRATREPQPHRITTRAPASPVRRRIALIKLGLILRESARRSVFETPAYRADQSPAA